MEQMYYTYVDSPAGKLMVAGTRATLKFLSFPTGKPNKTPAADWIENGQPLKTALVQLSDYFAGKRQSFDLSLTPEGSAFQKRVWHALLKIPYGHTTSYGEIAQSIGRPKASRAVGAANGKNPIAIIIPCHRVIGKSGDLTGFGGGLEVKKQLLSLEQSVISSQTQFAFPTTP